MPYEVQMGNRVIGTLGLDGKMNYDPAHVQEVVREMIAGQASQGKGKSGGLFTSVKVIYKWDRNRSANNDAVYKLWKSNSIIQNRVRQLNALTFGRGFMYAYDEATQLIIDRCWRLNRLRQKLNAMGTDSQLYGETFIGLFPQNTGDVLIAVYESNQVQIDFSPANVDDVNMYLVGYKDEESNKDVSMKFLPAYKYLNEIEMASPIGKVVNKVKKMVSGGTSVKGADGVMIHIKFNNGSAEIYGTSDFRQVYTTINEYMDFRGDRMAIHQLYGSPMFDIEITTDDPDVITSRIEELAGFTIGSNPVHNALEKWTPMEFNNNPASADSDEKAMRGLICAGAGFPEHLLFNQGDSTSDGGEFALNKLAEDRQDSFGDAFIDMNKFIVAIAGGNITMIDQGQIIFPEISTMSEKAKAETYVLKVGSQICSRETASYNTGHNWDIEHDRILTEAQEFGVGGTGGAGSAINSTGNTNVDGMVGGRLSTKANNQNPTRDAGLKDRQARADAKNVTTQVMSTRKASN